MRSYFLLAALLASLGGNLVVARNVQAADAAETKSTKSDADGVFVGVGYGGRRILSTDGKTWETTAEWVASGGDDDNLLRGVVYAEGRWVAVGGSRIAPVAVSYDGKTWDEYKLDGGWLGGVAYGNGYFVAVGGGGRFIRSRDGHTWVDAGRNPETVKQFPRHYRSIAFGNGVFVAVGDKGRRTISADGVKWTNDTPIDDAGPSQRVAFGDGKFVAVGTDGYRATSTDGITWKHEQREAGVPLYHVAWNGKHFYASGGKLMRSTDGETWETLRARVSGTIGHGAGLLVGSNWKSRQSWSADGETWTFDKDDGRNAITGFAFGKPTKKRESAKSDTEESIKK